MRSVLLVLAPGRSVTTPPGFDPADILRLATDAGLIASICPDGETIRCEPLDRAAAPGFVESMLAAERAHSAELRRRIEELQRAHHAALAELAKHRRAA